jgi:hypothetical protein
MGVALIVAVAAAVAVAVAVVGVGGYFLRGRAPTEKPTVHHARCPRCEQKVRYSPGRAGRHVTCPRCRRHWLLPETPQPLVTASYGRRPLQRVESGRA